MTEYPDAEITDMQTAWLERYRATARWILVAEPDGYSVHEHTIDGVAPSHRYATKEQAAARLLQLMGIAEPVTPQSWPEAVCVSSMESNDDAEV